MERPRGRLVKPRKAARWTKGAAAGRSDIERLTRWVRATPSTDHVATASRDFSKYNVQAAVPEYDDEQYEKHLTSNEWTKDETDYLMETYRECNGKWPVIIDHYEFGGGAERTMEDLKARFYSVSAAMLSLATPITSMTGADYAQYEMLSHFNPAQEASRKKLAEGHLYRRANEVDEETVLLGELQRIMLNQATVDSQREELRKRLDYPPTNGNGYQYTTSQALTTLWQQLLAQDRMKKNPRLRPTGEKDSYARHGSSNQTQGTLPSTASQASRPRPPALATRSLDSPTQRLLCPADDRRATRYHRPHRRALYPSISPKRTSCGLALFSSRTSFLAPSPLLRTSCRSRAWRRARYKQTRSQLS